MANKSEYAGLTEIERQLIEKHRKDEFTHLLRDKVEREAKAYVRKYNKDITKQVVAMVRKEIHKSLPRMVRDAMKRLTISMDY